MISNNGLLPHIYNADGSVASLSFHWLQASLQVAAEQSGESCGWFIDEIAQAIVLYFTSHGWKPIIGFKDLEEKIRFTLRAIGYSDLARFFRVASPHQKISLLSYIQNPPVRNEADFFVRLQSSIHLFHRQGAQSLHFFDLGTCEEKFQPAGAWFSWCQPVSRKAKIVQFVRCQLALLFWAHPFRSSIT